MKPFTGISFELLSDGSTYWMVFSVLLPDRLSSTASPVLVFIQEPPSNFRWTAASALFWPPFQVALSVTVRSTLPSSPRAVSEIPSVGSLMIFPVSVFPFPATVTSIVPAFATARSPVTEDAFFSWLMEIWLFSLMICPLMVPLPRVTLPPFSA